MATDQPTNQTDAASAKAMRARVGAALMIQLTAELRARKVPDGSYVMVDIAGGGFVSGKTPEEVKERFELLHPGAEGWIQRFGGGAVAPDLSDPDSGDEATTATSNRGRTFARRDHYRGRPRS